MSRLILTISLCSYALTAYSYGGKDSMNLSNYRQLHFSYSNDLYHTTDRYLTQLAYFKYITPWKRGYQQEMTLQQNVYTPSDIFGDTVQKNDRPYTSLLAFSYKKIVGFEKSNILFNRQITAGFLGEYGFGEQTQREIHYAVDSRQALGWQFQLSNALYMNAQAGIDKGLIIRKNFEYIVHGQGNIGTVFNDISAAQTIRFHVRNSYFLYRNNSKLKSLRFSISMRNALKMVAYNGTLQGGIGSRHNIYTLNQKEISPFVYYQQVGLHLAYQRLGITFSESYISKEFKAGLSHQWSTVLFCYLF